jgi:hypothetical protein
MDRRSLISLFLWFSCSPPLEPKVAKISAAKTAFIRPVRSGKLKRAVFKQFQPLDYRLPEAA